MPCHIGCILRVVLVHALQLDDLESRVGCDHPQDMCREKVSCMTCETGYQCLIESARAEIGQEKFRGVCNELVLSFFATGEAGVLTAQAHDTDGCKPRQVTCQDFEILQNYFGLFVQEMKERGFTLFHLPTYDFDDWPTILAYMKPLER